MLLHTNVWIQKTVMHIINVTTMITLSWHVCCGYLHFYRTRSHNKIFQFYLSYASCKILHPYEHVKNDILRKIIIFNRYYRHKT